MTTIGKSLDMPVGCGFSTLQAMQCFIVALYCDTTMPEYPWPSNVLRKDRNQAIVDATEVVKRLSALQPYLRSQLRAYTRSSRAEVNGLVTRVLPVDRRPSVQKQWRSSNTLRMP